MSNTILSLLSLALMTLPAASSSHAATWSDDDEQARLSQAKELMGPYYKRSSVQAVEEAPIDAELVRHWVKSSMAKKDSKFVKKISDAIIAESSKHGFDPFFLMAVIRNESSFNIKAKGTSGEIGLMQLMPSTGKWFAPKIGMKYQGKKTLLDPVKNIKLGAAYLAYLRDRFDSHGRLYLAAYNMGQRKLDQNLEKSQWPKVYPIAVMSRYIDYYKGIEKDQAAQQRTLASVDICEE